MKSIGILASHNGSGFDALYIKSAELNIQIPVIISNNPDAKVLQKAKENNIDNFIINAKTSKNPDKEIEEILKKYNCEYVFLSGYMKKISPFLTQNFSILNSHPSLLPKYGGSGMYGRFVHEAVIKNNENKSGVTIHFVNENYDEGEVLLQKELAVKKDDTPESLENKVKALEKEAIVEAFKKLLLSC